MKLKLQVQYDFCTEFPTAQTLFDVWPDMSRKILDLATKTKRDNEVCKLLDNFKDLEGEG